jgi:hypothetical protein
MAGMTLEAVHADSERRRWPLSERIVDEKLGSSYHVPGSVSDRDRPPLTQRPSKREQPTSTKPTTTMLATLNPTITPRGVSHVAPTAASTTNSSWT